MEDNAIVGIVICVIIVAVVVGAVVAQMRDGARNTYLRNMNASAAFAGPQPGGGRGALTAQLLDHEEQQQHPPPHRGGNPFDDL